MKPILYSNAFCRVWGNFLCMYLIFEMQTTDKATTKLRTQWQHSKAQHALTTALDKKIQK